MINHILKLLTATMPMKTIIVNGSPYLERYFVTELTDGTQIWLHRFFTNDSERHLHTHPWSAVSIILDGWYMEETKQGGQYYKQGDVNIITPDKLHRVVEVHPDTWTMMIVDAPRHDTWAFIEEDGSTNTQAASARDWYKSAGTRKA